MSLKFWRWFLAFVFYKNWRSSLILIDHENIYPLITFTTNTLLETMSPWKDSCSCCRVEVIPNFLYHKVQYIKNIFI
jgi:hypothetical protein